jgi:hypothetical protein
VFSYLIFFRLAKRKETFRKLFLSAAKGLDNFTGAPDCLWLKLAIGLTTCADPPFWKRRVIYSPFDYQIQFSIKAFRLNDALRKPGFVRRQTVCHLAICKATVVPSAFLQINAHL